MQITTVSFEKSFLILFLKIHRIVDFIIAVTFVILLLQIGISIIGMFIA